VSPADLPLADGFGPLVALVGAGPGDPGLITRRGAELLARAEVVLYDRLVSPEMLELAPATARMVCVDQLPGCNPDRIGTISQAMVEAAEAGKRVVRLKGGDPILFGRCLEEVEPLVQRGIPYLIVPGVTAALGAAAYAGIPVTDRRLSSAVALVTGHENPAKTEGSLDWEALARFPGTLVFYMGIARLENLANRLMAHGKAPETPASIVAQATMSRQRVLVATLGDLVARAREADLKAPAVCMVGPVVECRPVMNWFDRQPFSGKRILACRPRDTEGGQLITWLRDLGASVHNIPTLEIVPTETGSIPGLHPGGSPEWDWLVFSSQPGVQAFFTRLNALGLDARALAAVRVAAVGEHTGAALLLHGIRADCWNPGGNAESLAAELQGRVAGRTVLLVRADRGRDVLAKTLAPVCQVREWVAYRQEDRKKLHPAEADWLAQGPLDAVVLTSGNIARALARLLDAEQVEAIRSGKTRVFSLSPVTSAVVRELGWPVAGEAGEPSMRALVQVMLRNRQS